MCVCVYMNANTHIHICTHTYGNIYIYIRIIRIHIFPKKLKQHLLQYEFKVFNVQKVYRNMSKKASKNYK